MKRARDGAAAADEALQPLSQQEYYRVFERLCLALDNHERPSPYSLLRTHLELILNGPRLEDAARFDATAAALRNGGGGRGIAPGAAHVAAAARQLARVSACLLDAHRTADALDANCERYESDSDEEDDEDDETAKTLAGVRKYATPLRAVCFDARPRWRFVASYDGGALASLNPGAGRLELRLLRARLPPIPDHVRRGRPSRQLAACLLQQQLPAFELARQLRVDVALDSIAAVHLARCDGDAASISILSLDLSAAPSFARRRLRCATLPARAWRGSRDFTGGAASSGRRIQLVGACDDVAQLAALLGAAQPRLAALMRAAVGNPLGAAPPPVAAPAPAAAPPPAAAAAAAAAAAGAGADASDSDENVVDWRPDTTLAFVVRGDDADGALFGSGVQAVLGVPEARDDCTLM